MKTYLFYTSEGFTYDSSHNKASNMQVLCHGEGENINDAFTHFKQHQSYILSQAYKNVMAIQTVGNTIFNLEL